MSIYKFVAVPKAGVVNLTEKKNSLSLGYHKLKTSLNIKNDKEWFQNL